MLKANITIAVFPAFIYFSDSFLWIGAQIKRFFRPRCIFFFVYSECGKKTGNERECNQNDSCLTEFKKTTKLDFKWQSVFALFFTKLQIYLFVPLLPSFMAQFRNTNFSLILISFLDFFRNGNAADFQTGLSQLRLNWHEIPKTSCGVTSHVVQNLLKFRLLLDVLPSPNYPS